MNKPSENLNNFLICYHSCQAFLLEASGACTFISPGFHGQRRKREIESDPLGTLSENMESSEVQRGRGQRSSHPCQPIKELYRKGEMEKSLRQDFFFFLLPSRLRPQTFILASFLFQRAWIGHVDFLGEGGKLWHSWICKENRNPCYVFFPSQAGFRPQFYAKKVSCVSLVSAENGFSALAGWNKFQALPLSPQPLKS